MKGLSRGLKLRNVYVWAGTKRGGRARRNFREVNEGESGIVRQEGETCIKGLSPVGGGSGQIVAVTDLSIYSTKSTLTTPRANPEFELNGEASFPNLT